MSKSFKSRVLLGAAAAALAPVATFVATTVVATPAFAQDYTAGAVAGTVIDQSGAPVAGARVTLTSRTQGFTRTATTSSSGGYRFAGLPIGNYDISVDAPGSARVVQEDVRVVASATSTFNIVVGGAPTGGDEIVVSATRQSFDFANTTTGVNLDVEQLAKDIPISRDLTALTLLAPGTSQGDNAFGNLSAVGGSSVAENAYYLNGLNITDFNNYLGSSLVPFEFYQSVEVKTGGYPAEFGRATGGVVNAVTKSGSNDFRAAAHFNWEPDALSSDAPDTFAQRNGLDETRNFDAVFEIGGPIIKDRLFAYGIVQLNDNISKNAGIQSGVQNVDTQKSPFFGIKVDAYPIDNHHLEFTYFDTDRKTTRTSYDYDTSTDTVGADPTGLSEFHFGGESFVGKYTGVFTEWLTLSAAYGKNNDRNEFVPLFGAAALPFVRDTTSGGVVCGGVTNGLCNGQTRSTVDFPQVTQREFWRADADLFFNLMGDHHIRMGWDQEKNLLVHDSVRTGGGTYPLAYLYRTCGASPRCTGTPALMSTDRYVELNYFNTGGVFDSKNIAYYLQDEWNVTDRLTLNLGARLDQFNNFTADGSQFADFNKLFAPRGGFSFDPWGDGRGRLYGSFGVYFLPIAGNTAFRQGAQETYFREYWTFTGVNGDGTPILGSQLTNYPGGTTCPFQLTPGSVAGPHCNVTSDGSVQDPTASIARNLRATREREIIVGYEHQLTDLWTVGVNYTRRNLRVTAEDAAVDLAILNWCADPANGLSAAQQSACSSIWTGFHQYTIINPGFDQTITLRDLLPGDTELRTINFTAGELGYDKAVRTYQAIEFTFDRQFDGVWSLQGSYTWSKSEGNSEGYVQSDFGQDDAGITQDFDQPGFLDGAFGKLPNHRAHRIKMWGTYQVTEELSVGGQMQITSPRPLSCFGYHPANAYNNFENVYGAASHYCQGVLSPRGTALETDWIYDLSLSARYNIEIPSGQTLTLRADVFNILNRDGVTERYEFGDTGPLVPDPDFGKATAYQTPRYVRFGADINF